jgi:hypothetical protein
MTGTHGRKPDDTTTQEPSPRPWWPRERREMHAAWHGIPVWMVTASGGCPECRP